MFTKKQALILILTHIMIAACWFYTGTVYGQNTATEREQTAYSQGVAAGGKEMYDIAMIRIKLQDKQIEELKSEITRLKRK